MPNAYGNPVVGKIIAFGVDRKPGEDLLFRVTQTFDHINPDYPEQKHGALDMGNHRCGDSVLAAAAGKARPLTDKYGAKAIIIDHGDGWQSLYWHLSGWKIPLSTTTTVKQGELIGLTGNTGLSDACHLHFELHYNGVKIDPWPHLIQNGAVNVEESNVKLAGVFIDHVVNKKTNVKTTNAVGAWGHDAPSTSKESRRQLYKDGTLFIPSVKVKGEMVGTSDTWYGGFLWVDASGWEYIYLSDTVLTPFVDYEITGITEDQYNADVAAARKAGKKAVADAAVAEAAKP